MPAFFVTGTDTGVGKTIVSAALLAATRRRGWAAAALKPAETGCARSPSGELIAADATRLAEASGLVENSRETCLYTYETPAAPAVAARIEERPISLEVIRDAFAALQTKQPALLLVEGAGGLLVPFTEQHAAADLARALDLPLLIVARPGLGTINHCALTVECARHRGLGVRGIILSHTTPLANDPTTDTNSSEIERVSGVPVLGSLPLLPDLTNATLAAAAERHLPVDAILTPASTPPGPPRYR